MFYTHTHTSVFDLLGFFISGWWYQCQRLWVAWKRVGGHTEGKNNSPLLNTHCFPGTTPHTGGKFSCYHFFISTHILGNSILITQHNLATALLSHLLQSEWHFLISFINLWHSPGTLSSGTSWSVTAFMIATSVMSKLFQGT